MAVMAGGSVLTRADLEALPDDGRIHQLVDGAIVMTPSPGGPHQSVVGGLYRRLWAALDGTDLRVMVAPYDVVLGPHVVVPDLVVAPSPAVAGRQLTEVPLLVVEVRSASTAWLDSGRKRTLYAEAGVPAYWLVDPDEPSIAVLHLTDGRYEQVSATCGREVLFVDFPAHLEFTPAELLRG